MENLVEELRAQLLDRDPALAERLEDLLERVEDQCKAETQVAEAQLAARAKALASLTTVAEKQQRVCLTVGGRSFVTSRETIASVPTSRLAMDLAAAADTATTTTTTTTTTVFYDRDPALFPVVLQFLREWTIVDKGKRTLELPTEPTKRRALVLEARYYQIQPLVDCLEGRAVFSSTTVHRAKETAASGTSSTAQKANVHTHVLPSSEALLWIGTGDGTSEARTKRSTAEPAKEKKTHRGQDNTDSGEDVLPSRCYMCKQYLSPAYVPADPRHPFLCMHCTHYNLVKRQQTADLRGRIALVTGGRIKIGFATSLKLLRLGATVLVTTRFPADAAKRYSELKDYDEWKERLRIYAVDFRHLPSVDAFVGSLLASLSHLDILVNNAAQTVRRPPAFYEPLMENEQRAAAQGNPHLVAYDGSPLGALGSTASLTPAITAAAADGAGSPDANQVDQASRAALPLSVALSQVTLLPGENDVDSVRRSFPANRVDEDGQPIDLVPDPPRQFMF